MVLCELNQHVLGVSCWELFELGNWCQLWYVQDDVDHRMTMEANELSWSPRAAAELVRVEDGELLA